MLRDRSPRKRQALAAAAADRLRREERLVDPILELGRDPNAVVGDLNHGVASLDASRDPDRAAVLGAVDSLLDRVSGIDHDVEEADVDYLRKRIPAAITRTIDGIERVTSIVRAMKRFSHPSGAETERSDLNEAIETTLAVCRNEYKYSADVELDLGPLPRVICNIGEINQVLPSGC